MSAAAAKPSLCICEWDGSPDARRTHTINPLCPEHFREAEPDWAHMHLSAACDLRWKMGRLEYAKIHPGLDFVGDSLYEAMEEVLDALNYIRQAARENRLTGARHQEMQRDLVRVAERIRQELLMEEAEAKR
jgi:hypothetical protein